MTASADVDSSPSVLDYESPGTCRFVEGEHLEHSGKNCFGKRIQEGMANLRFVHFDRRCAHTDSGAGTGAGTGSGADSEFFD